MCNYNKVPLNTDDSSSSCVPGPRQRSFTVAVQRYERGDYDGAVALFEEALGEYFKADVECRALCQSPQRFEGYDFLRYRYSLHEVVSGERQTHLTLGKFTHPLYSWCFQNL